jgi:hypothetical protein
VNGTAGEADTRGVGTDETNEMGTARVGGGHRARQLVTWSLALLTVPMAVIVLIFSLGAVMSTAGCNAHQCRGPSGFVFEILFYGAPAVAALTILISFFTARRGWGIVVPLCGLALLVADIAVMALAFAS